jgi:hypothetical protein
MVCSDWFLIPSNLRELALEYHNATTGAGCIKAGSRPAKASAGTSTHSGPRKCFSATSQQVNPKPWFFIQFLTRQAQRGEAFIEKPRRFWRGEVGVAFGKSSPLMA